MTSTQDVTKTLDGLTKSLVQRPPQEGESELGGALLAVDHINRLAWRYFVQKLPYQGESVMKEVRGVVWGWACHAYGGRCYHWDAVWVNA